MLLVFKGIQIAIGYTWCDRSVSKDVSARHSHLFLRAASSCLGIGVTLSVYLCDSLELHFCQTPLCLGISLMLVEFIVKTHLNL